MPKCCYCGAELACLSKSGWPHFWCIECEEAHIEVKFPNAGEEESWRKS